MTCAPLAVSKDLKILLEEGLLSKLCPPGIVPREYEALQVCMSTGEPGTQGHYLLAVLSTLSGPHTRLRDVLLFEPDFLHDSTPLTYPFMARASIPCSLHIGYLGHPKGPTHARRGGYLSQGSLLTKA